LADQYGLLVAEVGKTLRRFKKVYLAANREAQEARALKAAWMDECGEDTK